METQKLDITNLGDYYGHYSNARGIHSENPCWEVHRGDETNNPLLSMINDFHPELFMFVQNQKEITASPLEFVKSNRYSKGLKAFHLTIGTIGYGLISAIHHVYMITKVFIYSIFFTLKSLGDLETRKGLWRDIKMTFTDDFCYHISSLVKSLLQTIPVAGIFLPSLYNAALGFAENKINQICKDHLSSKKSDIRALTTVKYTPGGKEDENVGSILSLDFDIADRKEVTIRF